MGKQLELREKPGKLEVRRRYILVKNRYCLVKNWA
jgi:hypothetical protein